MVTKDFLDHLQGIFQRSVEGDGELSATQRLAIYKNGVEPGELQSFTNKVHHHAYKITDEDMDQLRSSGLSDDEIFEATICAALGAATKRWEAAEAAMKGLEN